MNTHGTIGFAIANENSPPFVMPPSKEVENPLFQLPKEEQLEALFGIEFNQLVKLQKQFRDGCIHYLDSYTGTRVIWSFIDKRWRIPSDTELQPSSFS
jgi:hypothetical protein